MLLNKTATGTDAQARKYAQQAVEELLNFVVPIVLVGLTLAVFVLYLLPTFNALPKLGAEITDKTQEISVLQAKVAQLKSLQENRDLVVSDLVKMSWALEERDKVPELSEQVRLMSKDAGVAFRALEYSNAAKDAVAEPASDVGLGLTPDPALYKEEKVNVSINSASLALLTEFLRTAERSIRLFKVESLRISTRDAVRDVSLVMSSPYLNPSFTSYSQSAAPIDLKDSAYRGFMADLDKFSNYAQKIDATLPKL
jgi:hypothetical protein